MSDTETTKVSHNPLTATRHREWKEQCEAQALILDALDILDGTETSASSTATATVREFNKRKSKIAGYILSTLDQAHRALLKGISIKDPAAIWKKLNDHYETKDASTRFFATQKLMTITYRDADHPVETLFEYGNRAVDAGNQLKSLLPEGFVTTPATATATCNQDTTHTATANVTQGTAVHAFSGRDLVDEFTVSIIILGLGTGEDVKMVRHAILHGSRVLADALLELRNADQQEKSDQIATTGAAALAAKTFRRQPKRTGEWKPHFCKEHGPNNSHDTKECKKLNPTSAKVAMEEERANIAEVAHLASPPRVRNQNEKADIMWNADSGATSHMTPHKEWIRNMQPCKIPIRLANNEIVWATGKGSVVFNPSKFQSVTFSHVLYVPQLSNNLFSIISAVLDSKLRVTIQDKDLTFSRDEETLFTGSINGKVAMLNGDTLCNYETAYVTKIDKNLLHQRLGHIGKDRLERLVKQDLGKGLVVEGVLDIDTCEHCIAGKQHRDPFPKLSQNRTNEVLERIHVDVHGPLPRTINGYKYWIVFVDDASRNNHTVPLKAKSEASDAVKKYIIMMERQTGKKVKVIRDDKGGEFMSKDLQAFLDERGIIRERTVRATPSQNGVAERLNRTLAEGIVAMLNQANLPQSFWSTAMLYLSEILKSTPSSSLSNTTSYEYWHKRKPDLTMFRTFGCCIYVNVLRKDRKNLDSHTRPCIFIGFQEGFKGWKFYDPVSKKDGVTRDAIFDEGLFPGLSTKGNTIAPDPAKIELFWTDSDEEETPPPPPPPPPPTPPTTPPPPPPFPPSSESKIEFPSMSQPNSPINPTFTPERKRTFAETASKGKGKVLIPPQGSRPLRKAAEKVTDYFEGTRRTTKPAPRRETDQEKVADRGGEKTDASNEDEPDPPPFPGLFPSIHDSNDEEADIDVALKATPIVESLEYVYGESNDFVSWMTANQIGLEIAIEKAFSAGIRPEDSPRSWKDAMTRPDADKWLEAAENEVEALRKNGTWDLVQLPQGRKAIGSRWVFLIKRKSDGSIERYKARLVAKGYAQVPGMDFNQVFAPTARLAALRAILAQAALNGERIESLDISNAYLNGELEKEYEVYMEQPEGFTEDGKQGERWVCKLKKGLYGLKQAGRLWYQKLGETLEKLGFKQTNADPSIYVWQLENLRIILPVFVDDITITSNSNERIAWIKEELAKQFKLRDLGPTTYLLGIKVEHDRENRTLQLSQKQYIVDMLERFNMSECSGIGTPMDPGSRLSKTQAPKNDEERAEMAKTPYINAVGALMYLAVATRPDIAYTVAKLAQFNSDPGQDHWKAVKHLFRYLKSTMDLKLTYKPVEGEAEISSEIFRAYSDADHAGCIDTRRSTTGYFLKMGTGAVSWSSRKQSSVAWSSTEAEYVAASTAGQEVVWMRGLLKELGFKVENASPLIMDNQSAIAVVKNPEHHGRMKHIDIRHHWLRQESRRGSLKVYFVPTAQMTADILTKPLPKPLVEEHRLGLGIM